MVRRQMGYVVSPKQAKNEQNITSQLFLIKQNNNEQISHYDYIILSRPYTESCNALSTKIKNISKWGISKDTTELKGLCQNSEIKKVQI